jgi:diacylglycerol kinase (ATP)
MIRYQHNAWIHVSATILVVAGGIIVKITRDEWIYVVLAAIAVWTAEALNTAFEYLADVTNPTFHPLVEKAKDVAAGAVLITAIGAAIIGAFVFLPYLIR